MGSLEGDNVSFLSVNLNKQHQKNYLPRTVEETMENFPVRHKTQRALRGDHHGP